jgi:uncharacterized SAM-binding protein YcdF (DUF218 family)
VTSVLRRTDGDRTTRDRPARPVRRWLWRGVLLVGVLVVGYVAVTFAQVVWTSRRDGARHADAIVVLGAAQYNCRPSPVLEQRLDHALDLYQRGLAGRIVVTGGKQAGDRCTEASTSADYLMRHGVPESALLRENNGSNTWESLAAAARILRDRDLRRAVLVTSGYHALRAREIAGELGLDASVSPSHMGGSLRSYVQETGAVSIGRIIGYRRLVDLDDQVEQQIKTPIATDHTSG